MKRLAEYIEAKAMSYGKTITNKHKMKTRKFEQQLIKNTELCDVKPTEYINIVLSSIKVQSVNPQIFINRGGVTICKDYLAKAKRGQHRLAPKTVLDLQYYLRELKKIGDPAETFAQVAGNICPDAAKEIIKTLPENLRSQAREYYSGIFKAANEVTDYESI